MASENMVSPEQKTEKLEWVEPEVRILPVTETALNPGIGGDGGVADCTLS